MSKIEEIKKLLEELESPKHDIGSKIGIGITTHNRPEHLDKCLNHMNKFAPEGAKIVVVDDASTIPVKSDYRFNQNVGIAVAKNKCLELLYLAGCEHIFLFDDDTWPIVEKWWEPYIASNEPHLNYIFKAFKSGRNPNDTIEIYRDSEICAYSHVRGCMMYYHRSALEKVGGMDPVFGKWGYEHPSLSDRIYMAGLTTFRYMDVVNSDGLFYSDDEHNETMNTTVRGGERQQLIARNAKLYEERRFTKDFIPFITKSNVLLTCYFTSVKDPQNNRKWEDKVDALKPLISSLKGTKLVVLHDCLDDVSVPKNVELVKVETSLNPYFQRWVSYKQYLSKHREQIDHVFCIDGTDVELLKDPDWSILGDSLWVGDENTCVDDDAGWMRKYHKQPLIEKFLNEKGKQLQMLNAGIIGGQVSVVEEFLREIVHFYSVAKSEAHFNGKYDAGSTDMGAFNYILRTKFGDKVKNGGQVCTRFKADERNNYSWFKHK